MNTTETAREATDKLLGMYQQYKQLDATKTTLSRQLARAKLKNQPYSDIAAQHHAVAQQLQAVSDAMTFASPLIWMMYKLEAYANEAQPIRTMQDFRQHCSKPGYICTKRFVFLDTILAQRQLPLLSDKVSYPDDALASAAYDTASLLSLDDDFMRQWNNYEYHHLDGRVAKWENFPSS
jgi:hypothetical protein